MFLPCKRFAITFFFGDKKKFRQCHYIFVCLFVLKHSATQNRDDLCGELPEGQFTYSFCSFCYTFSKKKNKIVSKI